MFDTLSPPNQFVGRSIESAKIYHELDKNSDIRVLLFQGQKGVGKTALAESLVRNVWTVIPERFDQSLFESCWQEKWPNIIAKLARDLIGQDASRSATVEMLEQDVIEACMRANILVVLDNVESTQIDDIKRFGELWGRTDHRSVLVLTSIHELYTLNLGSRLSRHHIHGLDGLASVELFGERLRKRFGDDSLVPRALALKGVPLDILYVAWLDPQTDKEIDEHIEQILQGQFDAASSVEAAILDVTNSPTHFMALGITNKLEFDESLLAFFWDRLCSGTVEAYAMHRMSLVDRRLLIPVPGTRSSRFRVSEQVHRHLYQALERRIGGKNRVQIVHYYASEYYRRILDGSTPSDEALGAFVYHSLCSGEHQRAYRYVFGHMRLTQETPGVDFEELRQPFFEFSSAMAINLRETLQLFLAEFVQESLDTQQKTRVLVELAHLSCDLGSFVECIFLTSKVCELLEMDGNSIKSLYSQEIWKRIWYYRGVSFYNTGNPRECARSYFRLVESSAVDNSLGLLSLGYFAHCLIQLDLQRALKYGRDAVDRARSFGHQPLLAKNLTSHAEALTYARKYDDAEICFSEAENICRSGPPRSTEIRELGRIMGSWAALSLACKKYDLAIKQANEAMHTSDKMGDYRRVACARQYKAIALHRMNQPEEALVELHKAIFGVHADNGRYALPPLFTLARWISQEFCGRAEELFKIDFDVRLNSYIDCAQRVAGKDDYSAFWRDYYWPILCIE